MKKKKGFYATLQPFYKKEVRYVQPYYYQDGAWHKQEELQVEYDYQKKGTSDRRGRKNVKRRKST